MRNYPKALLFHEKALDIQQQSLPQNHPDLAGSYYNLAVVYKHMGNYPCNGIDRYASPNLYHD
ncbi:unnamed protein product, partial [Adineta steineri]